MPIYMTKKAGLALGALVAPVAAPLLVIGGVALIAHALFKESK